MATLQVDGAATSKHEKALFQHEPVLNREEREEQLLQSQLDEVTAENKIIEQSKHRRLQQEINRINRTIDVQFADLIGDTPGLKVINPALEGIHGPGSRAPVGPLVASGGGGRGRGGENPRHRNLNHHHPSVTSASSSSASSSSLMVAGGRGARREGGGREPAKLPGPPHPSHYLGPPIPGQSVSNYAIAFPVPFEESGFNSVVRWADISFEETVVAALGPGANAEKVRQVEMPSRVLVTVTCYLLNEVLRRDPNVRHLWEKLRPPLLDAVFSPNMIAAEMAKRQQRLTRKPETTAIGALLREREGDDEEGEGGYLDGPLPPPSFERMEAKRRKEAEREDGVLQAFPARYANYDNPHDYASFCLWTEELVHAKRMNDVLANRVEELKTVVGKCRLVLDMAGRRVDRYRKQCIFSSWRTYTERMKHFRQTATTYITNARKRQLIESCFLKWRRVPLQEKVANLQMEVTELRRRLQMVQETHNVEVATLKANAREAQDQLQDMTLKDEALRNQMMESHRVETTGLRTALSKASENVLLLTKHSRRWERMAKTLRPQVLCKSVPKNVMMIALDLKHLEEDALSTANLALVHQQASRNAITMMEQLLCRWVNFMMLASPQRKSWVQVASFARHLSAQPVSPGSGPTGPHAALLTPLPESSEPSLFGPSGLLALVRELRRLTPIEEPDLAAQLANAIAAQNAAVTANITMNTTAGSSSMGGTGLATLGPMDSGFTGTFTSTMAGGGGGGGGTLSLSPTMIAAHSNSSIALYVELTELLHYYTAEGLLPCLLQQCPFLEIFYTPHGLGHLTNTICMCWVLSALFTGYVNKMIVLEGSLGRTPSTSYLRNKAERQLGKKANPAITGVIPPEVLNVPGNVWDEVSMTATLSSAVGSGAGGAGPGGGSYVMSNHSVVRKGANNSPNPWLSMEQQVLNGPPGSAAGSGMGGTYTSHFNQTGGSTGSMMSRPVAFRVTDLRELPTVRDDIDTASDMGVYLGLHDEDLPPSEEDYDIDDIMVGMVREEERELNERRRLRLKSQELSMLSATGGGGGGPGESSEEDNDNEFSGISGHADGAAAWYPQSSLGGDDEHGDDDGAASSNVGGGSPEITPGKIPFYWEKDDETFAGVREIQKITLDLEAQIIRERKRQAAQAAAFLMPAKEDALSVEQVQFLHLIPRPSRAFEMVVHKKRFRNRAGVRGANNSTSMMTNSRTMRRSSNSRTMMMPQSPMSMYSAAPLQASGTGPPTSAPPRVPGTAGRRRSGNTTQRLAHLGQGHGGQQPIGRGGLDDDDPRTIRRQVKRVSVLTFTKRLVRDHAHRQQWIGVARILTSLISRVRVLDYGHGVPTRKWGEGVVGIAGQPVDRSPNATPQPGPLSPSRSNRRRPTNNPRRRGDDDTMDDELLDQAHQNVGGYGKDRTATGNSGKRSGKARGPGKSSISSSRADSTSPNSTLNATNDSRLEQHQQHSTSTNRPHRESTSSNNINSNPRNSVTATGSTDGHRESLSSFQSGGLAQTGAGGGGTEAPSSATSTGGGPHRWNSVSSRPSGGASAVMGSTTGIAGGDGGAATTAAGGGLSTFSDSAGTGTGIGSTTTSFSMSGAAGGGGASASVSASVGGGTALGSGVNLANQQVSGSHHNTSSSSGAGGAGASAGAGGFVLMPPPPPRPDTGGPKEYGDAGAPLVPLPPPPRLPLPPGAAGLVTTPTGEGSSGILLVNGRGDGSPGFVPSSPIPSRTGPSTSAALAQQQQQQGGDPNNISNDANRNLFGGDSGGLDTTSGAGGGTPSAMTPPASVRGSMEIGQKDSSVSALVLSGERAPGAPPPSSPGRSPPPAGLATANGSPARWREGSISAQTSLSRTLMMETTGGTSIPLSGPVYTPSLGTATIGSTMGGTLFPVSPLLSSPQDVPRPPLLDLSGVRPYGPQVSQYNANGVPIPGVPDVTVTPPQHALDALTLHRSVHYVSPSQPKPQERFDMKK